MYYLPTPYNFVSLFLSALLQLTTVTGCSLLSTRVVDKICALKTKFTAAKGSTQQRFERLEVSKNANAYLNAIWPVCECLGNIASHISSECVAAPPVFSRKIFPRKRALMPLPAAASRIL